MDKFREVEPLNISGGRFIAAVVNDDSYNEPHITIGSQTGDEWVWAYMSEARALRDWLDRALGDREGMVEEAAELLCLIQKDFGPVINEWANERIRTYLNRVSVITASGSDT